MKMNEVPQVKAHWDNQEGVESFRTGFIKINCSRCAGRGHAWRQGKITTAIPCPRCGGSGCEPNKSATKASFLLKDEDSV